MPDSHWAARQQKGEGQQAGSTSAALQLLLAATGRQRSQVGTPALACRLPTSVSNPYSPEVPALRNMVCNSSFKQCVLDAPGNGNATNAAAVMGKYYPRSAWCSKALFDKGKTAAKGAALCFKAAGL